VSAPATPESSSPTELGGVVDRGLVPELYDRERTEFPDLPRLSGYVIRVSERELTDKAMAEAVRHNLRLSDRQMGALARGELLLVPDPREPDAVMLVPAASGGALGSGAVYARNLPAPGSFIIDPLAFAQQTSRNRKTSPAIVHPGFGSSFGFRADAVGIIGRLLLIFEGTYTSTATPATASRQWPWNLAAQVTLSANGINNLIQCDGLDLRALTRVRNKDYFIDRESQFAIPGASASGGHRLIWEIPLAYDDSLIGAVFAQTEETFLNLTVATGAVANLLTANPGSYSNAANWRVVTEFYSIPQVDTKAGRMLILPDITQLHGVVSRTDPFTLPDTVSPLTRTGGILLRILQRIDNDPIQVGNVDPASSVQSHRFRYGGNVVPLDVPGSVLRFLNELDYGDAVIPTSDVIAAATPPAYMVDDFVVAAPLRDAIHLAGITEAQVLNTFGAGTIGTAPSVTAGALGVHTVQEAMVAG
jgi:hypothetical protein